MMLTMCDHIYRLSSWTEWNATVLKLPLDALYPHELWFHLSESEGDIVDESEILVVAGWGECF